MRLNLSWSRNRSRAKVTAPAPAKYPGSGWPRLRNTACYKMVDDSSLWRWCEPWGTSLSGCRSSTSISSSDCSSKWRNPGTGTFLTHRAGHESILISTRLFVSSYTWTHYFSLFVSPTISSQGNSNPIFYLNCNYCIWNNVVSSFVWGPEMYLKKSIFKSLFTFSFIIIALYYVGSRIGIRQKRRSWCLTILINSFGLLEYWCFEATCSANVDYWIFPPLGVSTCNKFVRSEKRVWSTSSIRPKRRWGRAEFKFKITSFSVMYYYGSIGYRLYLISGFLSTVLRTNIKRWRKRFLLKLL